MLVDVFDFSYFVVEDMLGKCGFYELVKIVVQNVVWCGVLNVGLQVFNYLIGLKDI